MKNPLHISNFIKDLSLFRPLSAQQVQSVRDSIAQAKKLVDMFCNNFAQYVPHIDADVKAAAIG